MYANVINQSDFNKYIRFYLSNIWVFIFQIRIYLFYFFDKKNILLEPLIEANSSSISKEIINQGIGIGWMIKEFVLDDLKSGNLYEIKVDIDNIVTPLSIAYHKKYNSSIVLELIKYFNRKTDSECWTCFFLL